MTNNKSNLKARGTRILPLILAAATLAAVPVQAASVKCPKHPKARTIVSTTPSTCCKYGKKTVKCGACRNVLSTEYLKKKNHVFGRVKYKIAGRGSSKNRAGSALFQGSYFSRCRNCNKTVLSGTSRFMVHFRSKYIPTSVSGGAWNQRQLLNDDRQSTGAGFVSLAFARAFFAKAATRLNSYKKASGVFEFEMTGDFSSLSHAKTPSGSISVTRFRY